MRSEQLRGHIQIDVDRWLSLDHRVTKTDIGINNAKTWTLLCI